VCCRETIYFNPQQTHIAIVTVGGLCPGLNDVVRSLVSKASREGVNRAESMQLVPLRPCEMHQRRNTEPPAAPAQPPHSPRNKCRQPLRPGGPSDWPHCTAPHCTALQSDPPATWQSGPAPCPVPSTLPPWVPLQASDYGVPEGNILGIRYGFRGFEERQAYPALHLTRAGTDDIHLEGGTVLGTSSGEADVMQIVKWWARGGQGGRVQ
jgi:hypothetical protein